MEPSAEPETTSYLWLRTIEGTLIQVEKEHALSIPWIAKKVAQDGSCGSSRDEPITLHALVTKGALDLLPSKIEFANHQNHNNGTTSKEDTTILLAILKEKKPKEVLEFALATNVLEMVLAFEIAIGLMYEIFAKIKSPEMLCRKFEFFNVCEDDLVHMRSITDTRMTEGFLPKLEQGRERLLQKKIERQEKKKVEKNPREEDMRSIESIMMNIGEGSATGKHCGKKNDQGQKGGKAKKQAASKKTKQRGKQSTKDGN